MGKQQFDEFIDERLGLQDENASIDWKAKRDAWLGHVDQLYAMVEEMLKDYVESGKVKLQYGKKDISEDFIGKYSVKLIEIDIIGKAAMLEPIGVNIIGASGRVDLVGEYDQVKFVLVDRQLPAPQLKVSIHVNGEDAGATTDDEKEVGGNDLVWKIATPPPTLQYVEITPDSFFDALMEVIGGQTG